MKSLFKNLSAIAQSQDKSCIKFPQTLTSFLLSSTILTGTSFLLPISSAQAAPTRRDWCGTVWSVENQNTLAWINPATGLTTTASGPTSQITMPGGSMGTATAAIGIHKQSGTMYAFDRTGTTGTLYKYQFGVNTTWQAVAISGLTGLSGTQTIAGASNNLNKMSVDGNTLFIAESNGVAVYAIPLNSSGSVVGSATVQTYSFVGDPPGTPPHRSSTSTDLTGTEVINGGDIVTDEYGDVYNVTYNAIISYSGSTQILTTTKAYFYKQDPIARTWIYQGQTTGNASFAGAAFYRGDLYVKAGTQLKKVDLTRSGSDYTGWNNPLVNVGSPSSTSSADLAACGTPVISLTKTRQIYSDASLTTLIADQTKVKTGQYIKYTITAQNVGDAWARSTQIIDNLPTGTVYQPNSATLNGTNLGLASYPSSFNVNSPSISTGIVRYPTDPDTATLSFAVQVTATSGTITNQATTSYVDNDGLPSEPSVCTTTPKVNCGNDGPGVTVVSSFSVNGTVWNDVDGSITINGSEIGTNAGSSSLTIYAVDSTGVVVGKTTVSSTDGTYSIPGLVAGNYTLRLSNDANVAVGAPAPAASLPSNWVNTGENKNGVTETTTPGEIAVTVASANIINQNFGIILPPNFGLCPATAYLSQGPTTSTIKLNSVDLNTAAITSISTAIIPKGVNAIGFNRLNGYLYGMQPGNNHVVQVDANGVGYDLGAIAGVPTGNNFIVGDVDANGVLYIMINPGSTIYGIDVNPASPTYLTLLKTISLTSTNILDFAFHPTNGKLYGVISSNSHVVEITLPSGSGTATVIDRGQPTVLGSAGASGYGAVYFANDGTLYAYRNGIAGTTNGVIYKITGVESTNPGLPVAKILTSTATPISQNDGARCPLAPPPVVNNPNVLLVKRITAINGNTNTFGGDSLAGYIDAPTNPYDDNTITIPTQPAPTDPPKDTDKWLTLNSFMIGGINGGNIKPGDEIEYTIYYLSAGDATASKVLICDRIPENVTFMPTAFNSFAPKNSSGLPGGDRGIVWQYNGATESLTNVSDNDTAEYLSPGIDPVTKYPGIKCDGNNTNGVVVVNLGNLPNAIAPGTPINSYGFIRFRGRVK
jgi:uncharacterized repeat protein (TIGR01451 family)